MLNLAAARFSPPKPRTVGVEAVGDASVHTFILLVSLHIFPHGLDACHSQHKHKSSGGPVATEWGDDAPPGQARLQVAAASKSH
jgi:hypothetical protein